jgi:hypothetical protein
VVGNSELCGSKGEVGVQSIDAAISPGTIVAGLNAEFERERDLRLLGLGLGDGDPILTCPDVEGRRPSLGVFVGMSRRIALPGLPILPSRRLLRSALMKRRS